MEQPTQVRGHTLAVDSEKNLVYVAGGREGRSKLVIMRRSGQSLKDTAPAPQEAQQPVPAKPVLQNSVQQNSVQQNPVQQSPIVGQQLIKVP